MIAKLRKFVREAGLVVTFFAATSFLALAYVLLTQSCHAIANWSSITERLVTRR
jgi:hypothetical protein